MASEKEKDNWIMKIFEKINQCAQSWEIVDMIRKSKLEANDVDTDGATLLHWAALHGEYIVCRYLINARKADVNLRSKDGKTALHRACEVRDGSDFGPEFHLNFGVETVELLLKSGADMNVMDNDGFKPIHVAIINENLNTIQLLMKYGADLEEPTGRGEAFKDLLQNFEKYKLFEPLCKLVAAKKQRIH